MPRRQVNAGHLSAAEELVPLIEQDGYRDRVLRAIAQAGRVDEALRLAQLVDDERDRALLLSAIADRPSGAGDLVTVTAVANSIKNVYWRAHAIGAVAWAQVSMGMRSDTGSTIDQVVNMVADIDQGISHDQKVEQVVEQLCAFAKLLSD